MDSAKMRNRSMHADTALDRTCIVANENESRPLRLRLIHISSIT